MARTKNQHKGDTAQAHGKPFLKLAFSSGLVLVLFVAMGAGAQNLLKGNVLKQINAKPNTDLVDRYGDAANDPAVADALRKAQGPLTTEQIKKKNEAYDALQNGEFKPGADPTMAIMYGYVPPNMSPEQAQALSKMLPKMPRMPHSATPEDIARMAGEPDDQRTAIEPESPYIPYPESFAKAHGLPTSRKMQMIPQQTFPGQMAGMPGLPNVPGMPMMGFGSGSGMGYGLSKAEIAAQNQRIAEECIRARYGPVNIPTLQPGHNALAEQARKKNADQHIAESDHQSVVGVCDQFGNEITGIAYDPYGQPTVLHGGTVMPTFMYKGMYWHDRSQKYLTLARVYDPKMGRFLTRDPLGEAAGTNLYAYCFNNPISYSDPLGLDPTITVHWSGVNSGEGGPPTGGYHSNIVVSEDGQISAVYRGVAVGGDPITHTGGQLQLQIGGPRPESRYAKDFGQPSASYCVRPSKGKTTQNIADRLKDLGNKYSGSSVPYNFLNIPGAGYNSDAMTHTLLFYSGSEIPPAPGYAPGYDGNVPVMKGTSF